MSFPTLIIEAGFNVGASTSTYLQLDDSARGLLGTGTLGPDTVWTDITAYVRGFSCRRGASRVDGPVLRYEAGTCTIQLDDSDRRFDPDNLSGPYVSGGVTQVLPMAAVRVRATWNSVTYDVWRGYADSWSTEYFEPNLAVCTLQATDATEVLEANVRSAVAAVGGSEDTGARIDRILDSASWSATDRVIASGDSTLQSTTLDGSAWTEALLANDSEIGELYIDGAGRVVFRNRLAVLEDTRSNTSNATFGDAGGSELPYEDVRPDYDKTQLINIARITRSGGAEQTDQDTTSIAQFLTRAYERSDLILETDGAAADYAGWVVSQAKDPERRFAELVINARSDETNLFPQVLGREIGDRITVKRRPPGGGSVITRDVLIRGVAHEVGPVTWKTTWQLQSASRLQFLTLDHATLGVLDTDALAF